MVRGSSYDDRYLLARIADGDEEAFSIIYHRYRQKVYAFTVKIVKSKELAEDILHEVFLKLWLNKSASEIENLDAYFYVVSRNLTLNALRKHKLALLYKQHVMRDSRSHQANNTAELIDSRETASLIEAAKRLLPPQQRMVYELCKEKGMKYEEAAEHLAISRFTVKTHMQLALRSMRTYVMSRSTITFLFFFPIFF